MKDPKRPTIEDVARVAGTALSTASLALNNRSRVAPETRRAVLEAAEQLGYEGNYYAQRLKGRCDNLISLLALNLDFGVGTAKLKIMQRLLAAQGYDVPIYSYGSYGGGETADQAALFRMVRRQKPRAIVCDNNLLGSAALRELQLFISEGGVSVCYGYPDERIVTNCDEVIFDTRDNTYQAARHLLEIGHRSIGLYVPGARRPHEARLVGFHEALGEFGLEVNNRWLWLGAPPLYEAGGGWMAQQFRALPVRKRPTALCIVNDVSASAFVNEITRTGLRVPQDLSVVSHDDSAAAAYAIVPLTTVSHPLQTIAQQTVDFLVERLTESFSGPPRRAVITGELVVRQSTLAQSRKS